MNARKLGFAFLILAGCGWLQAAAPQLQIISSEVPLGEYSIADRTNIWGFRTSDNQRRVAFTFPRGTNFAVCIDAEPVRLYEYAAGAWFSPDGMQVAYAAARNGKQFLVLNGQEGSLFDTVGFQDSQDHGLYPACEFSPDSRRMAYVAARSSVWEMIVDGRPSKYSYEGIKKESLMFSPDSKRFLYLGLRGGKWIVNIDGYEEASSFRAPQPVFSPDSKHLAYILQTGTNWCVMLDGVKGPDWEYILPKSEFVQDSAPLAFSADSRHISYVGKRNHESYLVLDGKILAHGRVSNLIFSPDSKRTAFLVNPEENNTNRQVVVDGGVNPMFNGDLKAWTFSPDSRQIVYVGTRPDDIQREFISIAGKTSRDYDEIWEDEFRFSHDGKHFAYFAEEEKNEAPLLAWIKERVGLKNKSWDMRRNVYVVVDGERWVFDRKLFDSHSFSFSQDNRRWCLLSGRGTNTFVLVDGKQKEPCPIKVASGYGEDVFQGLFSPDSRHVVFQGSDFRNKAVLYVDGVTKTYDADWLIDDGVVFDSSTHLHGLLQRSYDQGQHFRIFRVEIELAEPKP